jgi:hypothetical protein
VWVSLGTFPASDDVAIMAANVQINLPCSFSLLTLDIGKFHPGSI